MTLCSGIGAPEMAAPWIDWRFASEIEAFPREVLRQRFGYQLPEEHNQGDPLLWGDMTEVTPDLLRARGIPLPDVLVAGTPCQDFSIAGLRAGTDGERGNLTLKFVEIVHAIVDARPDGKLAVVWENVPGILSDRGNAFGNFLGGLVGGNDPCLPGECPPDGKSNDFWKWHKGGKIELRDEDDEPTGEFEIVEPHHRPKWPGVGMVAGPLGRAAWATLDAQWFGVAQRRRRVFVVVDFGGACDPAAVLFEPKGLCGNPAPSRKKGEGVAATLEASTGGVSGKDDPQGRVVSSSHWGESEVHPSLNQSHNTGGIGASNQEVFSQGGAGLVPAQVGFRMAAFGEYSDDETASTLKQRDFKDATDLVAFDCKGTEVQSDTEVHPPLRSMGHMDSHSNAGGHAAVAFKPSHYTRDKDGAPSEVYPPLTADADKGDQDPVVAYDTTQITSKQNGSNPRPGDPCHPLSANGHPPAISYGFEDRYRGDDGRGYDRAPHFSEELGPTVNTAKPPAVAYDQRGRDDGAQLEGPHDTAALRAASGGSSRSYVSTPAVRRLTPVECARLQGFPDDHCHIPTERKRKLDADEMAYLRDLSHEAMAERLGVDPATIEPMSDEDISKLAADGPQYKAFGNSMARPVMKWILDRVGGRHEIA